MTILCTYCKGSGEGTATTYGHGPDDYTYPCACGECNGRGELFPLSDPKAEQQAQFRAWYSSKPEVVRSLCERFPPWHEYLMISTRKRCVIVSYSEGGTMMVDTTNWMFGRVRVFGVEPANLIQCDDMAGPDEGDIMAGMMMLEIIEP